MTVQRELQWLGLYDLPNEYVLSYNGGAITENQGNRLLFFKALPFEKVCAIAQFAKDYEVGIHIYTQQMIYVYRLNPDEKKRKDGQGAVYTELSSLDLQFLREIPVAKVLLQKCDLPYLMQLAEKLAPIIEKECAISYSADRYLEINAAGIQKGSGLLRLSELTGVPRDQILAIGDHLNDLSMLQAAGAAACPRNATTEVQRICGYVADADNNQGAVAEILEHFIFSAKQPD
jgi:hypothetical protein